MKVTIELRRETEYLATVEITKEKFNHLYDGLNSPHREDQKKAQREINQFIKPEHWSDDHLLSIDGFRSEDDQPER